MFELSDDLKKISAGKILEAKGKEATVVKRQPEQRGRRDQTNDQDENMDKAARRAAKKRR